MEKPKSSPKVYKSAREANEVAGSIREMIGFGRVKILEVMEGGYKVEYNGEEIEIKGHEESHWVGGSSGGMGMGMRQELRQTMTLTPESGIYQDRDAPEEFIEVMMFHEIREKEYAEAGFEEDAHERALRDEALYILQHFDGKAQQAYLEWAKEYRIQASEKVMSEGTETPQTPSIITTSEGLRNNLERLGASLEENSKFLEKAGILQNGELPLVDGTSRGLEAWGQIADIIMADKKLQRAIARLKAGKNGLPFVLPDIAPGSLLSQIKITEGQMPIYNIDYFMAEVASDTMVAFDFENFKDPEGRLKKANRLKSGEFGNVKLGVVFVDGSLETPCVAIRVKKSDIEFFKYCREIGCSMTDIEIYLAMQLIANDKGEHFDSDTITYLNGYRQVAGWAVAGKWDSFITPPGLSLHGCCGQGNSETQPCEGGRRSVRVFKKD